MNSTRRLLAVSLILAGCGQATLSTGNTPLSDEGGLGSASSVVSDPGSDDIAEGVSSLTTAQNMAVDAEEKALFDLVNAYRAQNGLPALRASVALTNVAQWMAGDMAAKNYFSHTDSLGRDPFRRMSDFGYTYNTWKGENLAAGTGSATTALNLWKGSPGHNANLLNANFQAIGLARRYSATSSFGWYWAQEFGGFVEAEATYVVPPPPLSPPSNLSVTQVTVRAVSLGWAAGVGADHYRIFRGTSSGGEAYLGWTRATSFSDSAVSGGQRYFYVVRSVAADGRESGNSNEVSALVPYRERKSPCPLLPYGDVDQNGWVGKSDADLIAQHASGLVVLDAGKVQRADVNRDGVVSISDALLILRYADQGGTLPACSKAFLGDVDCDGDRDSVDLLKANQLVAGTARPTISCTTSPGYVYFRPANMDGSMGTTLEALVNSTDLNLLSSCVVNPRECLVRP